MGAVKNAFHDEICERGHYEDDGRAIPPISTATAAQTIVLLRRAAELLGECDQTVTADICERAADLLALLINSTAREREAGNSLPVNK